MHFMHFDNQNQCLKNHDFSMTFVTFKQIPRLFQAWKTKSIFHDFPGIRNPARMGVTNLFFISFCCCFLLATSPPFLPPLPPSNIAFKLSLFPAEEYLENTLELKGNSAIPRIMD